MRNYPKNNLNLSKALRRGQTPWENKLWYYLRAGRMQGVKFKRQVPIGNYIVDFYSGDKKLAIELDGGGHAETEIQQKDAVRQSFLESLEIKVLRIWNNEIDENIDGVLEKICSLIQNQPLPNPPLARGGNRTIKMIRP